jgi:hypothetical protein
MKRLSFTNTLLSPSGKTFTWDIFSGALLIGQIKWHGPWRKYCFFPEGDTLWDKNCLQEVCGFIERQMQLRGII